MVQILQTLTTNSRQEVGGMEDNGGDCVTRGCSDPGTFFLARMTKTGNLQRGLYCDAHEKKFGLRNLREYGTVVVMADSDGYFDGVLD